MECGYLSNREFLPQLWAYYANNYNRRRKMRRFVCNELIEVLLGVNDLIEDSIKQSDKESINSTMGELMITCSSLMIYLPYIH